MTTSIVEYSPTEAALAELATRYKGVVYEVSKPEGMKAARAARAEIKALRVALGMTQPQLAAAAGIGSGTLAEIESGETLDPRGKTLHKLAGFFGVNPEWLRTGKGLKHPVASMRDDESELLLLFRALSKEGREYLLSRARALHADEHRRGLPPAADLPDRPPRPGH